MILQVDRTGLRTFFHGMSRCAFRQLDVFMDEMSRERSMHILVKSAMALKERQFILVTPLGLEALQRNCKAGIGAEVGEDGGTLIVIEDLNRLQK